MILHNSTFAAKTLQKLFQNFDSLTLAGRSRAHVQLIIVQSAIWYL